MNKLQNWSWKLYSQFAGPGPAAFFDGYPTEEAARQALEEYIRKQGGGPNWRRELRHLSARIDVEEYYEREPNGGQDSYSESYTATDATSTANFDYGVALKRESEGRKAEALRLYDALAKRWINFPFGRSAEIRARQLRSELSATPAGKVVLWEVTGEHEKWVREHIKGWNHDDWLQLLESLRKSPYWPMDENTLGKLLEDERARQRRKNFFDSL